MRNGGRYAIRDKRRPKDAPPEAVCRRDLAVGERQRNPRKASTPKAMHPHRMRILQPQRDCAAGGKIRVLCGRRMVEVMDTRGCASLTPGYMPRP